jgi:hypothetical protein
LKLCKDVRNLPVAGKIDLVDMAQIDGAFKEKVM